MSSLFIRRDCTHFSFYLQPLCVPPSFFLLLLNIWDFFFLPGKCVPATKQRGAKKDCGGIITVTISTCVQKPGDLMTPSLQTCSCEMGCSSSHHPCHHTAAESSSLPIPDSESNLCRDGRSPDTVVKCLENLSTLDRLTQATGGTEKSWYRCVFPFGVISLVIGMAGTGVTFTFNTLLQTKVVSLVLLAVGFFLLLVAAVCWKVHPVRRKEKNDEGYFSPEQGSL